MFMPIADDLVEKVRAILAQRKITKLVDHQEVRRLIMMELFEERTVGLCCDEVVDHIDGGGEKDLYIGIARGISDAFGQIGLTHPGITNNDHVHALLDQRQL